MSLSAVPNLIRHRQGLPVIVLLALGLLAAPAKAASLVLEDLGFSEVAGDFVITGGEVGTDTLRIFQDVTGPNIDLFTSVQGLRSSGFIGFRLESVLTNRTDTPWIFFDHELQEQFGVASPEEDGLSFAQQFNSVRPTSNAFSTVDEVTDVRDFVNFSGGVVNPNQTVTFRYFILDNAPNDLFFLRQRPNFAPGGVGVVPVSPAPPVAAQPTPPVAAPPAPPVVAPPEPAIPPAPPVVVLEPVVSPVPVTQVPEPGMMLGLLGLIGLVGLGRRVR